MICTTKSEFLTSLRVALENSGISDRPDILSDFRQHFEDGEAAGESEAEVCRKLGDVDDIIKQYVTEDAEQKASAPDTSGFGAETDQTAATTAVPPQYGSVQNAAAQPQGFTPSAGKIVGVLCLDVFLYSWAIPALISLICSLAAVALSFSVSGIVMTIGGLVSCFVTATGFISTGFAPISLVFLGLLFVGLGGMLVIATIGSVKGIVNLIITIINQHSKIFVGHKVLNKIGKKNGEVNEI